MVQFTAPGLKVFTAELGLSYYECVGHLHLGEESHKAYPYSIVLDPDSDSVRSVDPDSDSESGSRRAKMTHKRRIFFRNFTF